MKREFIVIGFDKYSKSCGVSKDVVSDYMIKNGMLSYMDGLYYSDTLSPVEVLVLFQNMLNNIDGDVYRDIVRARLLRCFEDDDLPGFISG